MALPAISKLSDLLSRYFTFALPIRLAIGGFITLVAGTGFGFVAEYAAYSWAIFYGIRPPLEGIPYLKVAVTGLTLAIFFGGAAIYLVVHFSAGALLNYASAVHRKISGYERSLDKLLSAPKESHITDWMLDRFRSLSFRSAFLTAAGIAGGFGAIQTALSHYKLASPTSPTEIGVVCLLIFLSLLLLWNKHSQSWFAVISVLALVVGIPMAFFHVDAYSRLLRLLGYGGGLPISIVVVEDPGGSRERTKVEGYLMLRTTSALIVYEPDKTRVREIPLQQVLFLDHAARPLSERDPKLPQ